MVSINLLPKEMLSNRNLAQKKIIKSIKIAQRKGVKIIGLGGLTYSVTRGGLEILDNIYNVHLTTGHAYTSFNVTSILINITDKFDLPKDKILISIVGSAGSIGSTCAKILTREGFKNFIFIDLQRKLNRIEELLIPEILEINKNIKFEITNDINLVKKAHFIITATNAPETIIKKEHLSKGTIILDDAQPSDVDPSVLEMEEVVVIEAGLVHTPNIHTHFNFGFRDKYDNYSCLAEIMILAAIDYNQHFVIHRTDLKAVDKIKEWSKNLNFRPAELQNNKEIISEDKLKRVVELLSERF
ncbi:MAG: hypothetical protein NZ866_01685 [Patescibacteria group bacterium]|nr:hypothetical protein [Patescibacteria group bacterium]